MPPSRKANPPKTDAEYFDRLSMAIFTAGLNWRVVENKWPGFRDAFSRFSPSKVAGFSEAQLRVLMKNPDIVRNEKKIRATVQNAKTIIELEKEHGSFKSYIDSFGKREGELQEALQEKFRHMGSSTARTFLWMVGYQLTPTKEEKMWMKGHHEEHLEFNPKTVWKTCPYHSAWGARRGWGPLDR